MNFVRVDLDKLQSRLSSLGVVIEYIPFYIDCEVDFDIYKQVAISGMQVIIEKYQNWIEETMKIHKNLKYEDFKSLTVSESKIQGNKISLEKFSGLGYDRAFFDPPYGLEGTLEEQTKCYNAINDIIFNPMFEDNLEIYEWSIDWSNYFDDGKEWWGAFYWTVYNRHKSYITAIGASATD